MMMNVLSTQAMSRDREQETGVLQSFFLWQGRSTFGRVGLHCFLEACQQWIQQLMP